MAIFLRNTDRVAPWEDIYKSRTTTPEQAVSVIESGDLVAFTYGREPTALGFALAARKEELSGVRVFMRTPSMDFGWYDPGWERNFDISVSFALPVVRDMLAERRCDFVPGELFGITDRANVVREADVLFVEVSPPDKHGLCSFGASVWGKRRAIACAKTVIAEVNKHLIRTYGDNFVHVLDIDYFVEHVSTGGAPGATDLLGRKTEGPNEVDRSIAAYVGTLIQDGDTLQIGVGSTSEWVVRLGALDDKLDLGWHSETSPAGVIRLIRAGVITGERKKVNVGKAVAVAFGGGTREDMDFVDCNPMFELYDANYVLDPRVIGANDNVLAINSAVSVDLSGQVAAESVGSTLVSGPGGQLAFAIGAQLSRGGRFVTVLPSTARSGAVTRIKPVLEAGTTVTLPRTLADIVVTEYGIARLQGKSFRERADALVSIAHPDFRCELRREAQKLFWP